MDRLVTRMGSGAPVPITEEWDPSSTGLAKVGPVRNQGPFWHRRPISAVRFEADIVFVIARVAVSVDGCIWHGCPVHRMRPRRNAEYWNAKIARNVARDARVDAGLSDAGWLSLRVWEHEPVEKAADRIEYVRP
jgi:DNA mismatch endonuclease Vsr